MGFRALNRVFVPNLARVAHFADMFKISRSSHGDHPMPDTASASADSSSAVCGAGVVLDLTVLLGPPGSAGGGIRRCSSACWGFRLRRWGRNGAGACRVRPGRPGAALAWLLHRMKSSATAMGALGLGALARRARGRAWQGLPLRPTTERGSRGPGGTFARPSSTRGCSAPTSGPLDAASRDPDPQDTS